MLCACGPASRKGGGPSESFHQVLLVWDPPCSPEATAPLIPSSRSLGEDPFSPEALSTRPKLEATEMILNGKIDTWRDTHAREYDSGTKKNELQIFLLTRKFLPNTITMRDKKGGL